MDKNLSNITFFKKIHRPIYYKATLNKMRNGDTLSLGSIIANYPSPLPDIEDHQLKAYAQAYINKETKGIYSFTGLWTIPSKPSRPDIWTTGRFTISKGVITLTDDTCDDELQTFFLVCRYIKRLINADKQNHYIYNKRINPMEDWFYVNSIPFHFDGFTFDKNDTSCELVYLRYKQEGTQLIKNTEHRVTRIKLDDKLIEKVCTPPLQAIFNKAVSVGAIEI